NQFVPEAVKHEGYIRVKMLKRRTIVQGAAPPAHNYRFELEFESEELRQKWIASPEHARVWPPLEKTMTTLTNYPVVLYDEVYCDAEAQHIDTRACRCGDGRM